MDFKDYYAALGVARDASADDIKKAYRRLARKHHPDVSKEAGASARMAEINEANAVLSDAQRRAAYDAVAARRDANGSFSPDGMGGFEFGEAGPGHWPEGVDAHDFSDFFAQLFGRAPGGAPRGARRGAAHGRPGVRRGADHHAAVALDIADAMHGATRQLTLRAPRLEGQGVAGWNERTLEVRIPAGVRAGQLIRLSGLGEPGSAGGEPGDLLLEVQFRGHPRFTLRGADLLAELPVAPWEAALGAVVPLEMPDGTTLRVRVPPGAQSGRLLSVPGKGLPGLPPGELELTVRVVLPSGLEPRARKLYEAMARELPDFDARRVSTDG